MRVFSLPLSFEAKIRAGNGENTNHPEADGNGSVLRLRQSNVNIPLKSAGGRCNQLIYQRLLAYE
jgi:hypothetical protein